MKSERFKWTAEAVRFLTENYDQFSRAELAVKLNTTPVSIKTKSNKLGLRKSAETIQRILSRPNDGQFKKGTKPVNELYDNAIVERVDKSGRLYKWIRVDGKWRMLHVHLWLASGREIPYGHIVVFKDKNSKNCDLSNIELISRAENLWRNRKEYLQNKAERVTKKDRLKAIKKLKRVVKKERKKNLAKLIKQRSKIKAAPVITSPKRKVVFTAPKRKESVFKTKKLDLSSLIAVKIDRKTIVYAKPGDDIERIKNKYLKL